MAQIGNILNFPRDNVDQQLWTYFCPRSGLPFKETDTMNGWKDF